MKNDKRERVLTFIGYLICAFICCLTVYTLILFVFVDGDINAHYHEEEPFVIVDIPSPALRPIEEIEPVETAVADAVESDVESVVEPAYGRFNVPLSDDLQEYII